MYENFVINACLYEFNLFLFQDISRDTKIRDINGNMFFLRDVIALFIKYLKDELEMCFQMLNINLTATDFHWVITVPAIWTPSGKQMMREAAYQVNKYNSKFLLSFGNNIRD